MEGCGDGTFQATGERFFNCPYGRGLYYPFRNLRPYQKHSPKVAVNEEVRQICKVIASN